MHWSNSLYIDTCLPFALRSAPKLFNILADLLSWTIHIKGVSFCIHYLDDFLTVGLDPCKTNLAIIKTTFKELGDPLAEEKIEGTATSLPFLGILFDSQKMKACLPPDKLQRTKEELLNWLAKIKATKRQILSLVGLLHHSTKVIHHGRSFVSRMYVTAAKVKELDYYTRLNINFRSDLPRWLHSLFRWNTTIHTFNFSIHTNTSGTLGCGAVFGNQWLQWKWPLEWQPIGIMAKELVPIVLSCAVWGPQLAKQSVLFHYDNLGIYTSLLH